MDTIKAINTRRSMQFFLRKNVPDSMLETILHCGLRAPSSKNSNPWFFVITKGRQKNQIARWIEEGIKLKPQIGPVNAKTGKNSRDAADSTSDSIQSIREAPVLILIFNRGPMSGGNNEVIKNPRGGRSLYTYACEMLGIGAAVQSMMLAAHALGLGSVYMADSYPARDAVQKALKTNCEMIGSMAIGYPAVQKAPRKVFKSLVSTWDKVVKNGIPTENFTAGWPPEFE